MTRTTSIIGALTIGVLALLSTSTLRAETVHRYHEVFGSNRYKDVASTTAWWDTTAQRVGLHLFAPSLVGGKDTPGYSRDLFVAGNHVYLVDGDYGLQVFDITDPANPDSIGSYNTSGFSSDVFVSGDHAFIADGLSGLQVIDVSDPTQPTRVGGYDTAGYSRGVTVEGDYAYVADGEPGGQANLLVFDVSDPTRPSLAGTLPVTGLAIGTFVAGNYVYLAGGPGGMQVIDIGDPRNPSHVDTYPTPTYARNVVVAAGRAFVATAESGLWVIDVSDPSNLVRIGSYDTPDYAFGIAVSGNRVYVADDETGVQQFEITSTGTPVWKSTVDTPAKAIGVAVSGGYVYVADGPSSLRVIRVSEPVGPLPLARNQDADDALCVASEGHLAYVLTEDAFAVIDITMPDAPLPLNGRAVTAIQGRGDIAIAGHHAFVAAGLFRGLLVFDITGGNPSVPVSFPTGANATGVAVAGDYAFVANGSSGLKVFDIRDPLAAAPVDTLALSGFAMRIALAGNHAFVASSSGIVVVDISDPSALSQVGSRSVGNGAHDISVRGDHAFVATSAGLRVFDISDPTDPTLVGSVDTPGNTMSVAVAGNIAVVGDLGASLPGAIHAIDITDPMAPTITGSLAMDGARGVGLAGDYALVADGAAGFKTVEVRHRLFDRTRNVAQSTDVYEGTDEILRVRLTTAQNDSVGWEVTADGASWTDIQPTASWAAVDPPGTDLRWRSTHHYRGGLQSGNPVCDLVELEYLHHYATIDSIRDVPDDDGGWVTVYFTRSGHDFFGDGTAVTQYVVYRRWSGTQALRVFGADSLPPGYWEAVDSVAASGMDLYSVNVPTHTDSAAVLEHAVYVVAAEANPSHVFYSPPDSGYSVGNNPATPPDKFVLYQNQPNPFNSRTTIVCEIPVDGPVSLQIFDVGGRLVRTLVNGPSAAGRLVVPWDGTDNRNQLVASGVYFYRLRAAGLEQSRKMTFVE
jgi:hypothetical protein